MVPWNPSTDGQFVKISQDLPLTLVQDSVSIPFVVSNPSADGQNKAKMVMVSAYDKKAMSYNHQP